MNNNNPALPILIIIIITTTTTTTIIVIIIYIRVRKGFIPRTLGKRHLSYDRDRKGGGILLLWFWGGGGALFWEAKAYIYLIHRHPSSYLTITTTMTTTTTTTDPNHPRGFFTPHRNTHDRNLFPWGVSRFPLLDACFMTLPMRRQETLGDTGRFSFFFPFFLLFSSVLHEAPDSFWFYRGGQRVFRCSFHYRVCSFHPHASSIKSLMYGHDKKKKETGRAGVQSNLPLGQSIGKHAPPTK